MKKYVCIFIYFLGEEIPSTETKNQALPSLLEDVEIAWKILSLPILEPLTSDRLNDTTKIVMACLVASVSVASMPINSDEMESVSVEIVENSLELFNTILSTIRQSTRAGGHILQNYITMGAWVLTSGLLVQLASASAVDISSSKRINLNDLLSHGLNLNKVQERFNVLSVALASEALTLSSLLVEDLSTEIGIFFIIFHHFRETSYFWQKFTIECVLMCIIRKNEF